MSYTILKIEHARLRNILLTSVLVDFDGRQLRIAFPENVTKDAVLLRISELEENLPIIRSQSLPAMPAIPDELIAMVGKTKAEIGAK